MGKILAVDLDGTLFYPKQRNKFLSTKNLEFVRKLIDSGNKLLLVTSRGPEFCQRVVKEIDRSVDYIAINGCVISIDGKIVRDTRLPNEMISEITNEIIRDFKPKCLIMTSEEYPACLSAYIKATKFLKALYSIWYKLAYGYYQEKYILSNETFQEQLKSGIVYSIRIFTGLSKKKKNKINKEINRRLREKYPSIEASWGDVLVELTPYGCSKANSLKDYLTMTHSDHNDIYVCGDSGNDISMFNEFHEHSFVMKHGYPSVKKYAKHEISRVWKMEKYVFGEEK